MIDPDDIKNWLAEQHKDRYWLAEELGKSKTTVDGWLSTGRTIPPDALKALERLMHPGRPITPSLPITVHTALMRKAATVGIGYEKFVETVLIREANRTDAETIALYGKVTPITGGKKHSGKAKPKKEAPFCIPEVIGKDSPDGKRVADGDS